MKKALLLFTVFALSGVSNAQTKKIFHKSHSGSTRNFSIALENRNFGTENSNFGEGPFFKRLYTYKPFTRTDIWLDSVIVSPDMSLILVKRDAKMGLTLPKNSRETISNLGFIAFLSDDSLVNFISREFYYNIITPKDNIKFIRISGTENSKTKEK